MFDYLPLGSMSPDSETFSSLGSPYFMLLDRLGGTKIDGVQQQSNQLMVFFILTGGTEQKMLQQFELMNYPVGLPIILLAHPGNNSLPASLEISAYLQQKGRRGQIVYLSHEADTEGLAKLTHLFSLMKAYMGMQSSRIGLVGKPSDWLIASMPDAEMVTKTWGPEVVPVDFEQYFEEVLMADSTENTTVLSNFITHAGAIDGPGQEDFKKSVDVYTGLQQVVKKNGLDALTLRCFDLVTQHQSTGCYALSQLNDDEVVSGCEGDLMSMVGMLWAKKLLQQPAWMANPAQINLNDHTLWLAHCTIGLKMTRNYDLLSHFETNLGIGIRGQVSPQPCTLYRIGGVAMDHVWIAEGHILESGDSDNLCRTQLKIELVDTQALSQLIDHPLGNHVILVFGHCLEFLTAYHKMFINQKHPSCC